MVQRKPTPRRSSRATSARTGHSRGASVRPSRGNERLTGGLGRSSGGRKPGLPSVNMGPTGARPSAQRTSANRGLPAGRGSSASAGRTTARKAARPQARRKETTLDQHVNIPLPEGKQALLTRRQLLYGALGIGALAAVGGAAGAVSSIQKEQSTVDTLKVSTDAVFTTADCGDMGSAPLTLTNEYRMPYGTLVWANSERYAACLVPTESSSPLAQVAVLPLGSGEAVTVLDGPVSSGRGFDIYDVRLNDSGIIWTEANCFSGEWRIYQATHSAGSIGSPVQVDQGGNAYDTPFIAVAGNRAFWQVMPNPDGEASSEDSLLKSAAFGSSEVRTDWTSTGRMSTPPYSTGTGIVITPRVDTSGVYHQLTLIDAESGQMQDSLALPASMKPLEAGYVQERFTFSFDAIYSYGDGIANLGTYVPVDEGGKSGDSWFRFDRTPTAPPAWAGTCFVVKSTRSVACVDVATRTVFSLECPDKCDDFGEYLASTGAVSTVVTYIGMPSATEGEEGYTLVRTWSV